MDVDKVYNDITSCLEKQQYHVTHKTIAKHIGISNKQCRYMLHVFFENMKRNKYLNPRKTYYKRSWADTNKTLSYIF